MAVDKTYGLTSEALVKARLGIDSTDANRDAVYKQMIYAATDFIEMACGGRRFKRATTTQELYDGNDVGEAAVWNWLTLRNGPLVSVSAVQYKTGSPSNPTWVDFSVDDYETNLKTSQLYFAGGMPRGTQNIRVTYVAGYLIDFSNMYDSALHTLPFELTDLCERLVTKLIKRRESEGRSQESFNNSSINWGAFLEAHDQTILGNYRRVTAV